ncbi:MAG: glucosaminidase domain-containing protein [Alistipes sp.]|nr:glucosaminidase domain-containing protein [Alistipes sp.]
MLLRVCTILLFSLFSAVAVKAQVAEPEKDSALAPVAEWVKLTPEEYIYRWRATAVDNMEVYGIPASITMAQAILESGFGNGYLARVANNHFCIKCKKSWTGRTITHADDRPDDCFRVYDSAEDSFADHANFLCSGERYESLFAYDITDYKSWAKGLKKAGYATAEDYAERLIGVVERYNLSLLDKKNGIALYDEYLAKEFGIKPESVVDESIATESTPVQLEVEVAEAESANMHIAYSDKGVDPNNYRVTINSHAGYNVYRTNGTFYIIANDGDTYESIAKLFELSPRLLRKFNDVKKPAQPKAHDIIYIEPKMAAWGGEEMLHTVAAGETLYNISQMYGIRLKALMRLNKNYKDKDIVEGQNIRLR